MAGIRIPDRVVADRSLNASDFGSLWAIAQPLGASPGPEQPFKVRETARIAALLDVVEKMPAAAIAIFPAPGEKCLEIQGRRRPQGIVKLSTNGRRDRR